MFSAACLPSYPYLLSYFCSVFVFVWVNPVLWGLWLDLIIWLLSVCCFHVSYSLMFCVVFLLVFWLIIISLRKLVNQFC